MKKYFEILRKCPLFNDIEDNNLEAILSCLGVKVKKFSKKETIFSEGERPKYIGILLSGGARIEQTDYFGNRSIMGFISPSELFGESFACADVSSIPINVVASEDAEIMLIDRLKITSTCGNACSFHRSMIYNLMKIVATKNILFHQKIEITSKRSTREKLLAFLHLQAKKAGSNSFFIPYDRQALADYLSVERSGLSNEISKLQKEGIISCRKNHFILL